MDTRQEILAKDFSTRTQLEDYVRSNFGLTTDIKEAVIIGTGEGLAKLSLSASTTFWGISCSVVEPAEEGN